MPNESLGRIENDFVLTWCIYFKQQLNLNESNLISENIILMTQWELILSFSPSYYVFLFRWLKRLRWLTVDHFFGTHLRTLGHFVGRHRTLSTIPLAHLYAVDQFVGTKRTLSTFQSILFYWTPPTYKIPRRFNSRKKKEERQMERERLKGECYTTARKSVRKELGWHSDRTSQ